MCQGLSLANVGVWCEVLAEAEYFQSVQEMALALSVIEVTFFNDSKSEKEK